MAWSELSDDLTNWSVPAKRPKNGTAHNVPLSAPARSLLKPFMCEDRGDRHASGQLVFPGVVGTGAERTSAVVLRGATGGHPAPRQNIVYSIYIQRPKAQNRQGRERG